MKPLSITAFALLLALASSAFALEKTPFDEDRFEALQQAGEVVLLDVYADWCSTCARQQKVIEAWVADNPDQALHVLEIDFDRDKQWVRHFRAPRQSTLLLYRGDQQLWFSVAETRSDVIGAELDKAFAAAAADAR